MVFKLTSFDKILQRHSSSASSPDQKSPEIYRHVSTSGLANKDEISHDYHMLPQNEVRISHVSCYHYSVGIVFQYIPMSCSALFLCSLPVTSSQFRLLIDTGATIVLFNRCDFSKNALHSLTIITVTFH